MNVKAYNAITSGKLKLTEKEVIAIAKSGKIPAALTNLREKRKWNDSQEFEPVPDLSRDDSQHSREITNAATKLSDLVKAIDETIGKLFVAIDQKKKSSPAFADRHKEFAELIEEFPETDDHNVHAKRIQDFWGIVKNKCD